MDARQAVNVPDLFHSKALDGEKEPETVFRPPSAPHCSFGTFAQAWPKLERENDIEQTTNSITLVSASWNRRAGTLHNCNQAETVE